MIFIFAMWVHKGDITITNEQVQTVGINGNEFSHKNGNQKYRYVGVEFHSGGKTKEYALSYL